MWWPFRRERRSSLEDPRIPLSDARAWAAVFGEWFASAAGVTVTYERALGVPAIWAAVNFIASTIAALPLQLFRRTDAGRITAERDPLYVLLHDAPNPGLTSYQWRKLSMTNTLTCGRAVTFIERNAAGRPMNLWPLDPRHLSVERRNGQIRYRYQDGARTVEYRPDEVIDIPFLLQPDGVLHHDPIERLRNAIGLAIALEEYASRFFQRGGVPPLQLVGPIQSPGAIARAATDIAAALEAAKRDHRPILPMPMNHELKPIGIDPEKGQLTDARKMQLTEIARIYQLPPVFLQDLTHGTFSNTEQQDLHFVKHTLTQWLKLWEQELNLKLFGARSRRYVEFNLDGILRGDFKTRMEGYRMAIHSGITTPNEIREMENWPRKGPEADALYMQGATVPLGSQRPAADLPSEQQEEGSDA